MSCCMAEMKNMLPTIILIAKQDEHTPNDYNDR